MKKKSIKSILKSGFASYDQLPFPKRLRTALMALHTHDENKGDRIIYTENNVIQLLDIYKRILKKKHKK